MARSSFTRLVFLLALLSALFIAMVCAFQIHSAVFKPLDFPENTDVITVEHGDTLTSAIRNFAALGVVRYPQWLLLFAKIQKQTSIRAGEYKLEKGINGNLLLKILASGKVVQYQITFIEGSTLSENIAQLVSQKKLVNDLEKMDEVAYKQMFGFLPDQAEGRFFPDTYTYVKGSKISEILKLSQNKMKSILDEEWENRAKNLPYKNAHEALIMASIIEKETGISAERQQIAGVFVRRLKNGMKLQTDPAVIYGLGKRFSGDLTRSNLRDYSPWNTYVIDGLPPTPIALPGRDAIHAALHPAEGNALYFVARGDGTHEFSDTLNQHNMAVARYQLRRGNNADDKQSKTNPDSSAMKAVH